MLTPMMTLPVLSPHLKQQLFTTTIFQVPNYLFRLRKLGLITVTFIQEIHEFDSINVNNI